MIKGWKKLNAQDKKHLQETTAESTRLSTASFLRNRKGQIKDGITCFECEGIARKVGLEERI